VQEVRETFGIPVLAVLSLQDLMAHIAIPGREADLKSLRDYRERYGLQIEA
jgi:orotate phosphoribosyltransferase